MNKPPAITTDAKSRLQSAFECILLVLCLAALGLRATFTEGPAPQPSRFHSTISDAVMGLVASEVLIFTFIAWLTVALVRGKFSWRHCGIEIGIALLIVAAALASFYAPHKRAAITASVTLLSPFIMAILLIQILDSDAKIKIVLICLAALGVVNAWQSAEQYFVSNQAILDEYMRNPESVMGPLGIQPGTLNHMLLEHRLFSKDVRGFFTTGNSAGAFAIMASLAALSILIERIRNRKAQPLTSSSVFACIALCTNLFGLFLTHSKGAIAAFFLAIALLILLLLLGAWIDRHRRLLFAACLAVLVVAAGAAAWYGLSHGRLPGGNSMLVRWQYWLASAKMYAEHPLAGVGPGNFQFFYQHFKIPSAPETVSDPHCFPLSLIVQYGPLGLAGFLLAATAVFWRTRFSPRPIPPSNGAFGRMAVVTVIAVCATMLALRPALPEDTTAKTFDEKTYIIFSVYLAPALAFAAGFWLMSGVLQRSPDRKLDLAHTYVTPTLLFCASVAVLIHSLIDYAIFEPGVLTAFCALIACAAALNMRSIAQAAVSVRVPFAVRIAAPIAATLLMAAYVLYVLSPIALSNAKIDKARQAMGYGQFELAHNLLAAATQDDVLAPEAPYMNGRIYLEQFSFQPDRPGLLSSAEDCLFAALERNRADYRVFDRLSQTYAALAEVTLAQRQEYLDKALDSAREAVELYPGSAEIHVSAARLADKLDNKALALQHYRRAVEIEDSFREQFRLMYPGREVFSRLGQQMYEHAKKRADELSAEPQK